MSVVKKIQLKNIRIHDDFITDFSPNITIIQGKNGTGKTSIIESIYIALQGTSFKGSDLSILKKDKPWWTLDVEMFDNQKRKISYNPDKISGKKQFNIDDKKNYRLNPANHYPVVLFEPDDLRLLNGSPTRRRQFIDGFIAQLNPQYKTIVNRYEKALKQRNNLLKRGNVTNEELFAWDISLSDYGSYIIEQRIIFIEKINNQLNEYYNRIAKSNDIVSIHYSHTFIGDIKHKLLRDLQQNTERDKIVGYTSIGPHRHDVIFQYNDSPALIIASRGEVRSIVLALKLLEVGIIEQITSKKPIILLDDVFSELDEDRQKNLHLPDTQIIITSTTIPKGLDKDIKIINL